MREARVHQAMESERVEGILNKTVEGDTSEALFGKTQEYVKGVRHMCI